MDTWIVAPAIFDIEVTSALIRAQAPAGAVRRYLERDLAARRLVTIGPRAARAIAGVAARTQLRAADAAYVWVASKHGLPLVTLDHEIADRVGTLCAVEAPQSSSTARAMTSAQSCSELSETGVR